MIISWSNEYYKDNDNASGYEEMLMMMVISKVMMIMIIRMININDNNANLS